jgi:uracil-DNA glycosylase
VVEPAPQRFRSIGALQRACRDCRACADAGFPICSRPVFAGRPGQRAMIVGQAPGATEGERGLPWQGRAGATLRRWLELDEQAFFSTFYCASVTRCFPGRSPSGRGDRAPGPRELDLCAGWLEAELALLRPRLVLTVGALAARRLLGVDGLTEAVGGRFAFHDGVAVCLPHPSGASGWHNLSENRERLARALEVVHRQLATIDPGRAA